MKLPTIVLAGLACLVALGCRTPDPSVALLERQNRMLEDEVYRLREVIEDYRTGMIPTAAPRRPAPLIDFSRDPDESGTFARPSTEPGGPTFSESLDEPRESAAAPRTETPIVPGSEQMAPPVIEFPEGGRFQQEVPDTLRSREPTEDSSQEELSPVPSDRDDTSAEPRWDRSVSPVSTTAFDDADGEVDSAEWVARQPDTERSESSEESVSRRRPVWSPER